MQCSCAEGWSTTTIARRKGWTWQHAQPSDRGLMETFLASGGTGNPSIDKFVREDLLSYSDNRYANTFLLTAHDGHLLGFVSNSMGAIKMEGSDLMERNMAVIQQVPVLYLHRLGVLVAHKRNGIATLLAWRVFETLSHSCTHSAAAAVALMVEPDNAPAQGLYKSLGFERVTSKQKDHELHILPYASAVGQIPPPIED